MRDPFRKVTTISGAATFVRSCVWLLCALPAAAVTRADDAVAPRDKTVTFTTRSTCDPCFR